MKYILYIGMNIEDQVIKRKMYVRKSVELQKECDNEVIHLTPLQPCFLDCPQSLPASILKKKKKS